MDQPHDRFDRLLIEPVSGDALVASLLERCDFPAPGTAVVCGVSGGADSMALLVLAAARGLAVTAVHVDHGLRPDGEAEAEAVRVVAARVGAAFRSERVEVAPGGDLEARARHARHAVLGPGAMTGHTADDQAETVLINLMRGAGLDGISAMTPSHRHPILALRRSETTELCARLGLAVIDDPSNADPRFVRNRVRHELLPLMEDISDRDVVPLLVRSASAARDAVTELSRAAENVDPTDTRVLRALSAPIAATAVRRWLTTEDGYAPSAAELERVLAVVNGEARSCQISGGRTVRRTAGVLRVEP